jgi:hypothetical protein
LLLKSIDTSTSMGIQLDRQTFAHTEAVVNLAVADKWGLYSFMYEQMYHVYVSVKKRGRGAVFFVTIHAKKTHHLIDFTSTIELILDILLKVLHLHSSQQNSFHTSKWVSHAYTNQKREASIICLIRRTFIAN